MVQLAVTMGCIALFVCVPTIASFSQDHPGLMGGAFVMSFFLLILLVCCGDFRRRWPLNIVLLGLFTLTEGFVLGTISSHYSVSFQQLFTGCYFLGSLLICFQFCHRVKKC